jgi:hypothetical protein
MAVKDGHQLYLGSSEIYVGRTILNTLQTNTNAKYKDPIRTAQ